MRWLRSEFIRNALAHTGVAFFAQGAVFLQKVVLRRIMPQEVIGAWEFIFVVLGFFASIDLGITAAAGMELPVLHGAQKQRQESTVRSVAFWSKTGQGLILSLGVAVYALLQKDKLREEIFLSLIVASLLIVITAVNEALSTSLQGRQKYVALSKAMFCYTLFYALVLPLCAYGGGLKWMMLGGVGSYLVLLSGLILFCTWEHILTLRLWSGATFKRLLSFGLPLRIVDYPLSLAAMADILLVSKFMTLENLAVYTTAKIVITQAAEIPSRIGGVMVNRIFFLSGAETDKEKTAAEMRDFLLLEYLILFPLMICTVVYVFSFVVLSFIPHYAACLPVLKVGIFSIYFLPQTTFIRNYWMLERKIKAIGITSLVALLSISLFLAVIVTMKGISLVAVALAVVCGYFLYYLSVLFSIGRELWGIVNALKILSAAVVSIMAVNLILHLIPSDFLATATLWERSLALGWKIGLAYMALVPLIAYGTWRTHLRSYLQRMKSSEARGTPI
jgi:O-antigen/teichoic acid export membrane protein